MGSIVYGRYRRSDCTSASEHDAADIGSYRREPPVTLERLYENPIELAHLPYLHSSTLHVSRCIQAGDWVAEQEYGKALERYYHIVDR
jgi:hypothetical protein